MAPRSTRVRLAWVTGTTTSVDVGFDAAVRPPTAGDLALEHLGQDSDAPRVHRPAGATQRSDTAVRLDGLRPLHPGVTLPLVAAYVGDTAGDVSAPDDSFQPEG